nr:hypothetical protein [uncultured Rhodococcus sp.]
MTTSSYSVALARTAARRYRVCVVISTITVILILVNWSSVIDHLISHSPLDRSAATAITAVTTALSALGVVLYPLLSGGLSAVPVNRRWVRSLVIIGIATSIGLLQPVFTDEYPYWLRGLRIVQIVMYIITVIPAIGLLRRRVDASVATDAKS